MKTKVVKFKLYPEDGPIKYAIGFHTTLINGRSFYIHTFVDFEDIEENATDTDIVELALSKIQPELEEKINELSLESSIIGLEININNEDYMLRAKELLEIINETKQGQELLKADTEEIKIIISTLLGNEEGDD